MISSHQALERLQADARVYAEQVRGGVVLSRENLARFIEDMAAALAAAPAPTDTPEFHSFRSELTTTAREERNPSAPAPTDTGERGFDSGEVIAALYRKIDELELTHARLTAALSDTPEGHGGADTTARIDMASGITAKQAERIDAASAGSLVGLREALRDARRFIADGGEGAETWRELTLAKIDDALAAAPKEGTAMCKADPASVCSCDEYDTADRCPRSS